MVQFGIALSSEEHGPLQLVQQAKDAEAAGFRFVMISDHYHPWIDAQGQSPFVWSVLGGIAAATSSIRVGTGVTCPIMRIHPAIIAQAAATAAAMLPGRFIFGVGSGEALNEHILGDVWPPVPARLDMLEEALDVMNELWTGKEVTFDGQYYQVVNARIYTLPEKSFPVVVAASGPESANLAAKHDGLVSTAPDPSLVEEFQKASQDGLPKFGQLATGWAPTEEEARHNVMKYWPTTAIPFELNAEVPLPRHFEALLTNVTEDQVFEKIPPTTEAGPIVEKARKFIDAGYDHIYFHQIGPRQKEFMEFAVKEVLPQLA